MPPTLARLLLAVSLTLGGSLARAEGPPPVMDFKPRGVTRVLQWAIDPFDSNQAWAMSTESVQFNPGLRSGQQWSVKFTRRTYMRVTGRQTRMLEFIKIHPSPKRRGNLFLSLSTQPGQAEIFFTPNYGETWKYLGSRSRRRAAPPRPQPEPETGGESAVDLSSLGSDSGDSSPLSGRGSAPSSGGGPVFKAYFDLLMTHRPGISPLSFDNYHTFFLVDFIPKPGIQFSFDLSPNPRFFQLDYEFTPRFGMYLGRFIVPFDDMNPHNMFGGYLNNSRTAQPNVPAFLPDIWADLGLGIKYKLLDVSNLSVLAHLYFMNGFQDGGTDPLGQVPVYPSFGGTTVPFPDNNGDKAIGARIQTDFFQVVTFAFSFVTQSWTRSGLESNRMAILGAHARVRPRPGTEARLGYVYFTVDLPQGANPNTFQRGGLYGEIRQRFGQFWYAALDAGVLQTDDRIVDAGDQVVTGGRVGFRTGMFDISLQYRHDFRDTPDKQNRDYAAARLAISL